jgi:UDP-N-acetylglucosamine acyltransferase
MISPLSYINPKSQIGQNVTIEAFAYIGDDVVIGDNTWIGPNVSILSGARIGKNCRIFPGAVISAIPQDLKFSGETTHVEIGDNTTIRECVTINKGTKDKFKTTIGSNCLLMAYVHVAHDCTIGNNCILANSVNLAGHITIEDFAILEGVVAVQQFITIGEHSFISGGSLVRKNVPPYVKAGREPLSYIGINSVGLSRRGFSETAIKEIENIYRLLYVLNKNVSLGLDEIKKMPTSNYTEKVIHFVQSSDKGIMRGPMFSE